MDTKARTVSLSSVLTCLLFLTLGACDSGPAAVEPADPPPETPLDTIPLYTEACTPRPANPGVTGQIVFNARDEDGVSRLYVVHPDGSDLRELPTGDYNSYFPRWSRDGSKVAFQSDSIRTTLGLMLYVMDIASGTVRAAAPDFYGNGLPMVGRPMTWTPDGQHLIASGSYSNPGVFRLGMPQDTDPVRFDLLVDAPVVGQLSYSPDGSKLASAVSGHIFIISADGSDFYRLPLEQRAVGASWSPDGCKIAFIRQPQDAQFTEVFYYDLSTQEVVQVTQHESDEHYNVPRWSPDSERVTFHSHPASLIGSDTTSHLYVVGIEDKAPRQLIDSLSIEHPDWSWAEPDL